MRDLSHASQPAAKPRFGAGSSCGCNFPRPIWHAYRPVPLASGLCNLENPVFRNVVVLLALALAPAAQAQTAPTAATPSTSSPVKPAVRKPSPPKPGAAATSAAPAAVPTGPCIGVIPHIGERFAVQRVGLTVFGNELNDVPIGSWGLDDLVVARVRAAVGTRFAVRRITYANNAFDPHIHAPSGLFASLDEELKGVVRAITHPGECERYVVVLKGSSQFGGTNQTVEGIGIVNTGIASLTKTVLFALSSIVVFDGRTYEIVKTGRGLTGQENTLAAVLLVGYVHGPNLMLTDFSWPPTPEAVTGLRDATRALLAQSLDRALPALLAP
jgi:hypothetical protein